MSKMNCEHVAHAASDYLERRLGPGARLAVWLHLLVCGACRAYVTQVRIARDALRALRAQPASEASVDAVMAALRRGEVPAADAGDDPSER